MADSIAELTAALADRYRIEREVGQGGMATVYLAEDLKHHRKVALKVLRPELAAILGAERFLQEIQVTANLQHPNILPLYDSGEEGGRLYYVMPFVEGESLADRLKREKQLGVEESVRLITSVASALHFAHQHGVVHRDIKPANILLQAGQALVADFGIALAVRQAGGTRLTETGLSLGTPHYMSPEQATGDRELDARSDVYSLAAVLYEMLTGDPPHMGSTVQAVVARLLAEKPAPVRAGRASVPANVDAALQRALAKIPADRFATAEEFSAALSNPAFSIPGFRAGGGESRTSWNPVSVGATLVAVILGAVAVWGWTRSQPEPTVVQYSMALPDEEAVSGGAPMVGLRLALSPDGRVLVYVGNEGTSGGSQLWVRNRDQLHARPIASTAGARRPFSSPDGSRVGFFTADQVLRVLGLAGEPPTTLNATDFEPSGGAWGSDGYIYGAARGQGLGAPRGIIRIPVAGGPVERVTVLDSTVGERTHRWPVALPNGRGVLYVALTRPGLAGYRLAVVDLRTGEQRQLVEAMAGWYAPTGHLVYVTADGTMVAAPFDLDKLELTGPGQTLLGGVGLSGNGVDVTMSDAGTLMYMSGSSSVQTQPVWVDRKGGTEPIDPTWTFPATALYSTMALSPDGTRLVVSQEDETGVHLWVKRLPRGPNAKLTFEGSINARASWAPDGRSIVFVSDRNGGNQVWRQVADGSAKAELMSEQSANEGLLSADGNWLIFRGTAGDRHIFATRIGDTAVQVVARSERGEDVAPALSPDSRWIAYVSDESGRDEIYLRPFPDANASKRQLSTAGGVEPRWSRSGRELLYRNVADQLVSIPIDMAGSGFTIGVEQVLFSLTDYLPANRYQPTYDVGLDDQRFVLTRRVETRGGQPRSELIVVENFHEAIRQKMRP